MRTEDTPEGYSSEWAMWPLRFWSAFGTLIVRVMALLGLYIVGVVLGYLAITSPGPQSVGIALAYAVLGLVAPVAIAVRVRRHGRTLRTAISLGAVVSAAVSVLFLPLAARAFMM